MVLICSTVFWMGSSEFSSLKYLLLTPLKFWFFQHYFEWVAQNFHKLTQQTEIWSIYDAKGKMEMTLLQIWFVSHRNEWWNSKKEVTRTWRERVRKPWMSNREIRAWLRMWSPLLAADIMKCLGPQTSVFNPINLQSSGF